MFGTHKLFHKAETINTVHKESSEHIAYLQRLFQQAKQLSQIIAYIWRWADECEEKYAKQNKTANQLKTYFDRPTENVTDVGENLKKLFRANPADPNDRTIEAKLLREVFFQEGIDNEQYIFPLYNKFELGDENPHHGYIFETHVSRFHGTIEDSDSNTPGCFKYMIPYPPRPSLGNATLDKDTLEDWIKNRKEEQYFAENPYIPTTSS